MTYLIQTTVFACLKNQSVAKAIFRDNFSVTSILIVIANSGVTENSSRAKFDNGFFSSQQPLHRLSAVPLPLHGAGKRAYRFYMHYQLNSIIFCLFGCGFALPTPCTGEAFTCGICTLHYQFKIKLIQRHSQALVHLIRPRTVNVIKPSRHQLKTNNKITFLYPPSTAAARFDHFSKNNIHPHTLRRGSAVHTKALHVK